jgi:hypothetical protein
MNQTYLEVSRPTTWVRIGSEREEMRVLKMS